MKTPRCKKPPDGDTNWYWWRVPLFPFKKLGWSDWTVTQPSRLSNKTPDNCQWAGPIAEPED